VFQGDLVRPTILKSNLNSWAWRGDEGSGEIANNVLRVTSPEELEVAAAWTLHTKTGRRLTVADLAAKQALLAKLDAARRA